MGDASNYHASLAGALVRSGHDVTVASHGSYWMNTARDIDLSRKRGKLGGALLWLKLNTILSSRLKGYDVVQLCGPNFVDLRPERLRVFFDRLKHDNGMVCMTALGTDSKFVKTCLAAGTLLKYSEYNVNGSPTPFTHKADIGAWLAPVLADYADYVYENVDGVVTALYEYHAVCSRFVSASRLAYGGIPIDIRQLQYQPMQKWPDGKVHFQLAYHKGREAEKGIDILMPLIERVVAAHPDKAALDIVHNVPYNQFLKRLTQTHIVVDQLYSYTPATTALLAMAMGRVAITGGEQEYYDFIGETARPILNPDPRDLSGFEAMLHHVIEHPEVLVGLSAEGRALVERDNDADIVAGRFIKFWESR